MQEWRRSKLWTTRDGDRERAEVANHIYAQRTPLQMSHEASSILDFVRPGVGLIVVKLDRLGGNTRGRSQPRARIGRKRRKPPGAGACHRYRRADGPHGPDCAGHGRRDGAWLYPRSRVGIDAATAKGVYKGRPATLTERASYPRARKGWAEIARAVGCKRGNVL